MRAAPCVLAAIVAATLASCQTYPYASSRYDPSFERVPGYQPGQGYSSGWSRWDYYRNYQGSLHPGPEKYP